MPPSILVVEDDSAIREALVQILVDEGYETWGASNAREAFTYMTNSPPPALIILDLMMPGMDGAEFGFRLRGNPVWRSIPLVLVSADKDGLEKNAALLKSVAHLIKPMRVDHLLEVVANHTGSREPLGGTA